MLFSSFYVYFLQKYNNYVIFENKLFFFCIFVPKNLKDDFCKWFGTDWKNDYSSIFLHDKYVIHALLCVFWSLY